MKNSISTSLILSLLFNPISSIVASESIFSNTEESAKESSQNPLRENLDYLFNTNYPLDDYLYKQKPTPKYLSEDFMEDPNALHQNSINSENEIINKADALQKEIEAKEQISTAKKVVENQSKTTSKPIVKNTQPLTKEQKLNAMLRDSILAERGNGETLFSGKETQWGVDRFSNQENIDNATNEHRLLRMVRAGRLIPAILMSAISSDLSGIVSAQVEEDIYATMGQAVMIPRGSKVIGIYTSSGEVTGHARLQIQWREIITPQGVNILLTNTNTADSMGMSGVEGHLNNRYLERFGIPYVLSTLTNVLLLSIATNNNKGNNTYSESIYNQSQTDLSTIVQEVLTQQRAIKPTIEIKAGSRIFIVPTHHIWFPKPRNGEVMTQYFK